MAIIRKKLQSLIFLIDYKQTQSYAQILNRIETLDLCFGCMEKEITVLKPGILHFRVYFDRTVWGNSSDIKYPDIGKW